MIRKYLIIIWLTIGICVSCGVRPTFENHFKLYPQDIPASEIATVYSYRGLYLYSVDNEKILAVKEVSLKDGTKWAEYNFDSRYEGCTLYLAPGLHAFQIEYAAPTEKNKENFEKKIIEVSLKPGRTYILQVYYMPLLVSKDKTVSWPLLTSIYGLRCPCIVDITDLIMVDNIENALYLMESAEQKYVTKYRSKIDPIYDPYRYFEFWEYLKKLRKSAK